MKRARIFLVFALVGMSYASLSACSNWDDDVLPTPPSGEAGGAKDATVDGPSGDAGQGLSDSASGGGDGSAIDSPAVGEASSQETGAGQDASEAGEPEAGDAAASTEAGDSSSDG